MKASTLIMALYLLLGSFLPRMDYSQLLHLKDLQAHYQLHQQEAALLNESYSMGEFLVVHFIVPDEHQHGNHANDHQELPFHSVSSSLFVFLTFAGELSTHEFWDSLQFSGLHKNVFHLTGFLSAIFHPPSL